MAYTNKRSQTQLTAPGTTATLPLAKYGASRWYQVVVATIDTNVVLRVEYTNTASGSVTARSQDFTLTANGTYTLAVFGQDNFTRLNFVSESGGTNATITATLCEETN